MLLCYVSRRRKDEDTAARRHYSGRKREMGEKENMPRNYGHAQGSKNVERICEIAYKMGIKYLTVYAFSTENWSRPSDEVNALMKLLRNYMKTCLKTAEKNRMRVRVIGDKTGLDDDIRTRIEELEELLPANDGLNFQIAINYGSRG